MRRSIILFAMATAVATTRASAQEAHPPWAPGVWVGRGWKTPTIFGATTNRTLWVAAIQLAPAWPDAGGFHARYTVGVIPVVAVSGTDLSPQPPPPPDPIGLPCFGSTCGETPQREPSESPPANERFGIGVLPFGGEFAAGTRHWALVGTLQLGGMWTNHHIMKQDSGSRFNFIATVGLGIVAHPPVFGHVGTGYRLVHISNGGLAPTNPGLDVSVWYVAWYR